MKILILISFLLLTVFSFGQIVISKVSTAGENQCSGVGVVAVSHVSMSLNANTLYIAVAYSDSSWNYASVAGTGGETWDQVAAFGTFTRRIRVMRCMPGSNISSDVTASFTFGNYPNSIHFRIYSITNVTTGANGANAIRQFVIDSAVSADPSLNLGSVLSNTGVLAFFSGSNNPFSGTAESGWTEVVDAGCATYPGSSYINGMYDMRRVGGSDPTPSFTAASSTWMGIALEFIGTRRIIITN